MRFTDAHSFSSVCTPTRYGILAGRYACFVEQVADGRTTPGAPQTNDVPVQVSRP